VPAGSGANEYYAVWSYNNVQYFSQVEVDTAGGPPLGAILTSPNGQVRELVGTTVTGGLIEQADQGGPQYDYQVGQVCH